MNREELCGDRSSLPVKTISSKLSGGFSMNFFVELLVKRAFAFFLIASVLIGCSAVAEKQELSARQKIAMAMFQERCKKAGEYIHKTVDGVKGIFLVKVRPQGINYHDQFAMSDPYGLDSRGDTYIKTFFSAFYQHSSGGRAGYRYVEAVDPTDGKRYRYTGVYKDVTHTQSVITGGDGKTRFTTHDFVLDREVASGPLPRYGVTYDDLSTREDRDYWIAGSSLRVIDLQTGEVIAERIGYMVDRGQGDKSGGRSPWLLAANTACPAFPADSGGHPVQADQTRNFVTKVLRP